MRTGTPGFVAARLTEAREARGFTQTSLAERTGIKPQSISHYEQGRQSPSPDALEHLCTSLEVPLRYFLRAVPPYSTRDIFFRSRTDTLKDARRLTWLKEISTCVRRYTDLPPVSLPSREGDIESAACAVRSILQAGSGPVGDIVPAMERLGCIVSTGAATLSQWDADVPWIFLDETDGRASWFRLRAAHELGHLVMHRSVLPAPSHDAEADRFARAFLLPGEAFGNDVWAPTIDALLTIKKEWNCPIAAMITRCGEIGRFDPNQVKRAMVNLARRGWNGAEPREPALQIQKPLLLGRSLRQLVEDGRKDVHSLLGELALNPADVEDLTGLSRGYFASQSELLRIQSPDIVIAQI